MPFHSKEVWFFSVHWLIQQLIELSLSLIWAHLGPLVLGTGLSAGEDEVNKQAFLLSSWMLHVVSLGKTDIKQEIPDGM